MRENVKAVVRQMLATYLEQNQYRKTPERFAILNAVYNFKGPFTLDELNASLLRVNFPVCRATLYNTMKLLIRLRLAIYHRTLNKTMYEASYSNRSHSHQICSVCGTVKEIKTPGVGKEVDGIALHRFRKEGYSLYIYGVCSSCQAKMTRRKKNLSRKNKGKKNKTDKDTMAK